MCRSKTTVEDVSELEDGIVSDLEDGIAFLDVVQSDAAAVNAEGQPWMVQLSLNNCQTVFKIDMGADVTVIPESAYRKICDAPLSPPGRILRGASQHTLDVCGKFKGKLRHGDAEIQHEIYVVRGLNQALVGRPAIEALKLAVMVEPVQTTKEAVVS